jgi:hypothetical protein
MARGFRFAPAVLAAAIGIGGGSCMALSFNDTDFKGDLRLRYQYDHVSKDESSTQRHRGRMRLRFGLETDVHSGLSVGLGLASGQTDNRSTNQTLTNYFATKDVRLDLAYAAWSPASGLDLLLGKYHGGLLVVDDLVWDGDINFEGASLEWERPASGGPGALGNAGFLLMNEDKSSPNDPLMFYGQVGATFAAADGLSGKLGIAYYDFEHVKGMAPPEDLSSGSNTLEDGRLVYDYDSVNPSLVLAYAPGAGGALPEFKITGDYIYNPDSGDSGFLIGVRAGHPRVKEKGSFTAYYNYRRLERDAWLDIFPDSDFYGGATNARGHEFIFDYAVAKNVVLGLDYYHAEAIEGSPDPLNTLQVDCVFKF